MVVVSGIRHWLSQLAPAFVRSVGLAQSNVFLLVKKCCGVEEQIWSTIFGGPFNKLNMRHVIVYVNHPLKAWNMYNERCIRLSLLEVIIVPCENSPEKVYF
jgi:hypothetical protein